MRAEEATARRGSRLPPPYWKGVDFVTTLWRLGLRFGPDWWTRDIRIVHRALVERGHIAWLGEAAVQQGTIDPAQDMDRAIDRITILMNLSKM